VIVRLLLWNLGADRPDRERPEIAEEFDVEEPG
jgi:hypothetical protein